MTKKEKERLEELKAWKGPMISEMLEEFRLLVEKEVEEKKKKRKNK